VVVECEGHGRYFKVDDGGEYVGTFEHDGIELCRRFAGRIALVYGFDAYEAECARRIAANPYDWDTSDVVPAPVLAMVRPAPEARRGQGGELG
jgi:hypothetical protein